MKSCFQVLNNHFDVTPHFFYNTQLSTMNYVGLKFDIWMISIGSFSLHTSTQENKWCELQLWLKAFSYHMKFPRGCLLMTSIKIWESFPLITCFKCYTAPYSPLSSERHNIITRAPLRRNVNGKVSKRRQVAPTAP